MDEVEAFRGQGNLLSNLHVCEHGCEINDKGMSFLSSRHHYQYKKLQHHDLGEESIQLVMETDPFRVMKWAKELLPDDKISDDWSRKACDEMLVTNQLKYDSYEHARDFLLDCVQTIVEATSNSFWGSGLNVQQTKECLIDYWPGQNNMGKILMTIYDKLQAELPELSKRKAVSPLSNELKLS